MARVVRREIRKRGFFGWLFLIVFIVFNLAMAAWLFSYWGLLSQAVSSGADAQTQSAARAGAAIGGTIGSGILLFFWAAGDLILGLFVFLTRGTRVIVEEPDEPQFREVDTSRWPAKEREAYEARRLQATRRSLSSPGAEPRFGQPAAATFDPEYEDDGAAFTDVKTQISLAAKQALARVKAAGGEIKARPDAIIISGASETVSLRSNQAILDFARELGL